MKKLTSIFLSLIFCLSLVACGTTPAENPAEKPAETPEPGIYTAESMIDEIKQMCDGVDVSEVVADKDVASMTRDEQSEFLGYLYDYAEYKDTTSDDYIKENFSGVSDDTANKVKAELEEKNFDGGDVDNKITVGTEVAEKYSFYDYTEADAIAAIGKSYSTDEENSKALLTEYGYYETEDATERSKILYLLLITY